MPEPLRRPRLWSGAILCTALLPATLPGQVDPTPAPAAQPAAPAPAVSAPAGPAPDARLLIDPDLIESLRAELSRPVVVYTLRAQNEMTRYLSPEEIQARDADWQAQRRAPVQPLIAQVWASPLTAELIRVQAGSHGLIEEIIVMDRLGLNAAVSAVTTDYFQGDEAKFLQTVPVGADALFIDEPGYNDDFMIWTVQVSFTLPDPDDPERLLGAVTVELNLNELARRKS